jgi:APA family basic amino acid/polyamine antiporter
MGILSCLLLMLSLPSENWLRLIVWLAIGLMIYFSYGRRHSVLAVERANGAAAGRPAAGR